MNNQETKPETPDCLQSALNDLLADLSTFPSKLLDCALAATAPNTPERIEFCRLVLPLVGKHISNINKLKTMVTDTKKEEAKGLFQCKSFIDGDCGKMNCIHAMKHQYSSCCVYHTCKFDKSNGVCVAS